MEYEKKFISEVLKKTGELSKKESQMTSARRTLKLPKITGKVKIVL
jgi:hypothetical protein